jgi:hypothetical protein
MVTDDERNAAVSTLRSAAEDGRLDPASLDARVALVRAAASRSDVAAALHGIDPLDGGPGRAATPATTLGRPGSRQDDPLNIVGGGSTARRSGRWEVPPFVRVQAAFSSVRLDCLDAVALAPVIDVQVAPGLGSVRIWLPPGWAVDIDRLGSGLGSVKSLAPTVPDAGCPVLVLRGTVGVGSLKVTGPSRRELRRRRRGG